MAPTQKFQELSYDVAIEDLFNLSIKLEEKEKVLANAEGEVGSGIRRVFLLEGEAEKREIRLATEVKIIFSILITEKIFIVGWLPDPSFYQS